MSTADEREIRRKLKVLRHAEQCANTAKTCRDWSGWSSSISVVIEMNYGEDHYSRLFVDTSANSVDVADARVAAEHFSDWLHIFV